VGLQSRIEADLSVPAPLQADFAVAPFHQLVHGGLALVMSNVYLSAVHFTTGAGLPTWCGDVQAPFMPQHTLECFAAALGAVRIHTHTHTKH
jgi:hypothetical protein